MRSHEVCLFFLSSQTLNSTPQHDASLHFNLKPQEYTSKVFSFKMEFLSSFQLYDDESSDMYKYSDGKKMSRVMSLCQLC